MLKSDWLFFSIFEYLSGLLDQSELEWFRMVSHKLWARRNQVVFGGEVWHPRCLLKSANEGLKDFHASQVAHVLPGLHLRVMGSRLTWMRLWIEGRSLLELGWLPVIIWVEFVLLCVRQWLIFRIQP